MANFCLQTCSPILEDYIFLDTTSYTKGLFFFNTGVMSGNFCLSENSQFDNGSLKSSCDVIAVVSELSFSNFGRI